MSNDTIAPPIKPTPKPVACSSLFGIISISTVGVAAAVWVEQEAPQFGMVVGSKYRAGSYTLFAKPNYDDTQIKNYLEAGGAALEQSGGMTLPSEELRIAQAVYAERMRCAAIAAQQYDYVRPDWFGADESAKTAYWIEQAILAGGEPGTYDGTPVPHEATP